MGVDYDAHYGLGVKIEFKEFPEDHEYEGDFWGYLDDLFEGTEYDHFQVGDGSYTGTEDDFYVVIDNPFINGFAEAEKKAKDLLLFLDKHEIKYEGKVDLVGGLRVW